MSQIKQNLIHVQNIFDIRQTFVRYKIESIIILCFYNSTYNNLDTLCTCYKALVIFISIICKSTHPDYIPAVKSSPKYTSPPSMVATYYELRPLGLDNMSQTSFSLYLHNQWTDFHKLSCAGKPQMRAIRTYAGCTKATTND